MVRRTQLQVGFTLFKQRWGGVRSAVEARRDAGIQGMTDLGAHADPPRVRKSKVGESFGKAATYFLVLFYVILAAYWLSGFRFNVLALGTVLSFAVLLSVFEVLSVKKTATRAQVRMALLRSIFLFGLLAIDTLTAFQGAPYVELSLIILPVLLSYELVHRHGYQLPSEVETPP